MIRFINAIPGIHELILVCDNYTCTLVGIRDNFTGYSKQDCRKSARSAGWILHQDGTASCPLCSGKKK